LADLRLKKGKKEPWADLRSRAENDQRRGDRARHDIRSHECDSTDRTSDAKNYVSGFDVAAA
jgi:hypothetical protein